MADARQPLLKVSDLRVEIPTRRGILVAVDGLSFHIDQVEVLGVVGASGAGKSTLLGVLAGRINPTSGTVRLQGKNIKHSREARALTGYLSHDSMLYSGLSAQENLVLYCRLYGVRGAAARVEEMLRLIGLWDRRDDLVGGFSRGMEQRLSIARSLLHDPSLLILDEPFSAIDPVSRAELMAEMMGFAAEHGATILISSHTIGDLERLCDRIGILSRGVIAHESTLEELKSGPGGSLEEIAVDLMRGLEEDEVAK